jgi:hypothetical protein
VIGFTVGLTMGRGPLGKRLRDTQKSILAVDATSPALPNRPGETISSISSPPAANTFNAPAVSPPALETEELRLESPSAQSLNVWIDRNLKGPRHHRTARPSAGYKARERLDLSSSCYNERHSPVALRAHSLERKTCSCDKCCGGRNSIVTSC